MSGCCDFIEPCHTGDCDGLAEVTALLPHGRIWNPERGGLYSAYIKALGHIKTEWNKRLCQEVSEGNPCTADRLLGMWVKRLYFPSCVDLTSEALCEWLAIISDPDCPRGSIGFIKRAIEFVAPGAGIEIEVKRSDFQASCWCASDLWCADKNPIVITAPPDLFAYEVIDGDFPHEVPDGMNACRLYFIPEIECLRDCVFPFGLGVGYKTDPTGPNGEDIWGVSDDAEAERRSELIRCLPSC